MEMDERLETHEDVVKYSQTSKFRVIMGRVTRDWSVDRFEREDIEQELLLAMLKALPIDNPAHYLNKTVTRILFRVRKGHKNKPVPLQDYLARIIHDISCAPSLRVV